MTATATRPMDALLTDALETAKLRPTRVRTWVEEDDPPNRPGPRLHFQVRVSERPGAVFAGVHELCIPEEDIAAWIAAKVLVWECGPTWPSTSDGGLDPERGYEKVRPFWAFGSSPTLSRRQARMTGRDL